MVCIASLRRICRSHSGTLDSVFEKHALIGSHAASDEHLGQVSTSCRVSVSSMTGGWSWGFNEMAYVRATNMVPEDRARARWGFSLIDCSYSNLGRIMETNRCT